MPFLNSFIMNKTCRCQVYRHIQSSLLTLQQHLAIFHRSKGAFLLDKQFNKRRSYTYCSKVLLKQSSKLIFKLVWAQTSILPCPILINVRLKSINSKVLFSFFFFFFFFGTKNFVKGRKLCFTMLLNKVIVHV